MDELYKQLKNYGHVKANEPLSKHVTFKIGGPVRYFVNIEGKEKLAGLLNYLHGSGIDFLVIGGGSNLLPPDGEYDGVVIRCACAAEPVLAPAGSGWTVEAPAGLPLASLVSFSARNSLAGLEWAVGIPGTIGGAVRGNAGAQGKSISDSLYSAEVWRGGEIVELSNSGCTFSYRSSVFKNSGGIILSARFALFPGDKQKIMSATQEYVSNRLARVPKQPSAGSFFKNIPLNKWPGDPALLPEVFRERGLVPAGWLVEQAGLKGLRAGGAQISADHGNFIINAGGATQSDVLTLVEEVKEKVYNKFGVELEPEVQIISN